jgi:hypothetical protein
MNTENNEKSLLERRSLCLAFGRYPLPISAWTRLSSLRLLVIFLCPSRYCGPPLWYSAHSSWLQIQRSGFDSRRYETFWEVVGLERGPPSLVSTTDDLLGRESSGSCLESREYGSRGSTLTTWHTISAKTDTNFTNRRRSLGRYSSLADLGHGV